MVRIMKEIRASEMTYVVFSWNIMHLGWYSEDDMIARSPEEAINRVLYKYDYLRSQIRSLKAEFRAVPLDECPSRRIDETPEEKERHERLHAEYEASHRYLTTQQIARFMAFKARVNDPVANPRLAPKMTAEILRESAKAYYVHFSEGMYEWGSMWVAKSVIETTQTYRGEEY